MWRVAQHGLRQLMQFLRTLRTHDIDIGRNYPAK
jgi:hypothetical protein